MGSYPGHSRAEPSSSLQEIVGIPSTSQTVSTLEIMKPCEDDFMLLYETMKRSLSCDEDKIVSLKAMILHCSGNFLCLRNQAVVLRCRINRCFCSAGDLNKDKILLWYAYESSFGCSAVDGSDFLFNSVSVARAATITLDEFQHYSFTHHMSSG